MVVLVTGGSQGIGAEICRQLVGRGATVYAASRRGTSPCDGVNGIVMDVTSPESVEAGVAAIVSAEGVIDAVVCNAGNGIAGAIEETTADEAKYQFETCFFGAHNVVRAVLPYMRAQGHGRILTTTSVAAVIPIPFQAFYSSVKAALKIYTEALQIEVAPYGIQCCTILPGDTHTGFTSARKYAIGASTDSVYAAKRSASVAKMEQDELHGMQASYIASFFVKQIFRRRKMSLVVTPRLDYKAIVLLGKILPTRLLLWIVGLIY